MATKTLRVLEILQGSDRSPTIRLKNGVTGDPFDLTNATSIQVIFNNRDRTKLTLDNVQVAETKASLTSAEVLYSAIIGGNSGNNIALVFDGIETIAAVITAWNTANPTNNVSSNAADDTVVPEATSFRLFGGYDAYFPVSTVGDPLLGKVKIIMLEKETNLLKRGPNQSFKIIIDEGSNPGGKRSIGVFDSKLNVINGEI